MAKMALSFATAPPADSGAVPSASPYAPFMTMKTDTTVSAAQRARAKSDWVGPVAHAGVEEEEEEEDGDEAREPSAAAEPAATSAKEASRPAGGNERAAGAVVQRPAFKIRRRNTFSDLETAPVVDRTPIKLYVNRRDPCERLLHVRVRDQVGFLYVLSEVLLAGRIDVDVADIATVGDDVDNRMRLRAPRPSDWKDAGVWCKEIEDRLRDSNFSGCASANGPTASKLAVNPHLLCVASFAPLPVTQRPVGSQKPRLLRYRMELRGINQAGLLLWVSLVVAQSGFNIVRAKLTTKDGHISDTFELTTSSDEAVRRLRSFLDIPVNADPDANMPLLRRQWAAEDEASPTHAEQEASPSFHMPSGVQDDQSDGVPSPNIDIRQGDSSMLSPTVSQGLSRRLTRALTATPLSKRRNAAARTRIEFGNGDVYEGGMATSAGGDELRHGYGTYSYASDQSQYREYSGQWRDNRKHGFGLLLWRDGSAYAGQWEDNRRHGVGVSFGYGEVGAAGQGSMPSNRYEGEWAQDEKCGLGVEETEDHIYCGQFASGKPEGRGLKLSLRVAGVLGCTVLGSQGAWQPLIGKLASPDQEGSAIPAVGSSMPPRTSPGAGRGSDPAQGLTDDSTPAPGYAGGTIGQVLPAAATPGARLEQAPTPVDPQASIGVVSPSLWGEAELAAIVACLGVSTEAAERVRGRRLQGAQGLLELSNSEMTRELGLVSPLERLVVRRSLQRFLEAEIHENSKRGRSCCDVMADPALSAHAIPLDRLTVLAPISKGGFGTVYRGTIRPREGGGRTQAVAVKEMIGDHRAKLYELLKEAHVMASLRHPNICRFIGVCADDRSRGERYIVSELLDCSLFDLVHRPTRTTWSGVMDTLLVIGLAEGICAGVAYIHAKSLVHADLKSSNILIDLSLSPESAYRPSPRICDFGHAAVRTAASPHDRLCTPHWAAPEVLRGEGLGPAADMYSVGVLLWEMLAKKIPHCELCFGQVLAAVGWAGLTPDLELLPPVPDDLRRLIEELLSFLPDFRPSSREAKRRLQKLPRRARMQALKALAGFLLCGQTRAPAREDGARAGLFLR